MILSLVENLRKSESEKCTARQVTKKQAMEIYEMEKMIKELKAENVENGKELQIARNDNRVLKHVLEKRRKEEESESPTGLVKILSGE